MSYRVVIERAAEEFLAARTPRDKKRLLGAIYQLPTSSDEVPPQGQSGCYKLCVGTYRVIFTIYQQQLIVSVIDIDSRRQVYK